MPAKIAILIAQKLADERTRKIIITIVAVVLSIIFLLVAGLQAIIALFTICCLSRNTPASIYITWSS